jgi:septal ring factor EnvC (AmiA/AmiB activator)
MKIQLNRLAFPALAAFLLLVSCTESKTTSQEETQIKSMDSTSRSIKENTEKLDAQTKKVEESLEKLDKEFETTN